MFCNTTYLEFWVFKYFIEYWILSMSFFPRIFDKFLIEKQLRWPEEYKMIKFWTWEILKNYFTKFIFLTFFFSNELAYFYNYNSCNTKCLEFWTFKEFVMLTIYYNDLKVSNAGLSKFFELILLWLKCFWGILKRCYKIYILQPFFLNYPAYSDIKAAKIFCNIKCHEICTFIDFVF